MDNIKLNKYIDHTLLNPQATKEEIHHLCTDAIKYDFMSVCVNPVNVSYAKSILQDSDVCVCTVVGFPLGANTIQVKQAETVDAINNGADEIDMVINIAKAKEHDFEYITDEIRSIVSIAAGRIVKVIIETCYLTNFEKIECCRAAVLAGAHFVKTSTGFGTGGATMDDIKLMRSSISTEMSVKASGGIRDHAAAIAMIESGASRIGTSNGIKILKAGEINDTNSSY